MVRLLGGDEVPVEKKVRMTALLLSFSLLMAASSRKLDRAYLLYQSRLTSCLLARFEKTPRLPDRDSADMSTEECDHTLGHRDGQDLYCGTASGSRGSGAQADTVFQIMLMRYINTLPAKDDVHRITVFLVPTVALVDQQSEAIAKNTSLRVRPYRGDMGRFTPIS